MVYFPARKCYHAAKLGILLILVVALLSFFEKWRGGKLSTGATFSDPVEAEFERQILEDEARIIPGLGEGGVAAHLVGEDKRLGEESEKKLAMNVYLSDRISYNRTLKDYRNQACTRVVYDAELPSASVILIFHNEPYSVVVRTVWSVVNSARRNNPWFAKANYVERDTGKTMTLGYPGQDPTSPFVYLKEIILVDDNSTLPELKGKLSHYVRTRLPPDLIRILRLPDRIGLTQARQHGARMATGDVLVFLDAHCEGSWDWLRPLLQRIKDSREAVVTPLIDVLDQTTFQYQTGNDDFEVGGFTFTGHFTWIDVPEREKKRRGSDIGPTWSPTMAGGLFAINRAYYWEMGAYDEQMAGWGGENLEMSFRIWQCGGTLETIPCSRVGHVFRSFHPYGLPANSDTHGINTARMAEVWMDEYAELFYLHRPDLRNNPKIGDVTHRKILREKLQCKSFQWYLDNIYKEKFVPVRDVYGYGRFMNPSSGFCLDTMQREGEAVPLGVYPCHAQLQATQYLSLSLAGELRDEEKCAQLQYTRRENEVDEDISRKVLMATCHGKQRGQKWKYEASSGTLKHADSGLCLSAGRDSSADVLARTCRGQPDQRWRIDYAEYNHFTRDDVEPSDRDEKLKKLRGQRRISRSLLSYSSGESNALPSSESPRRKSHRGKHKRKRTRTKNKFIVKLLRTLANGTEDHLEVDIHCKHRQLYPNNSFVRDLVTILNDRNIKVINNGRVFEKNKVTELVRSTKQEKKVLNKLDIQDKQDLQMPKKHHSKKHKHASSVHAVNIATQAPAGLAEGEGQGEGAALDKRIIIEDFVAVQSTTSTKRPRKHKKVRARTSPAPLPPPPSSPLPPSSAEGDTPLTMFTKQRAPKVNELIKSSLQSDEMKHDSIEDTPMLGSESERDEDMRHARSDRDGERDAGDEDWPVGVSRFRSQDVPPAAAESPPPAPASPSPAPAPHVRHQRTHAHHPGCEHDQQEVLISPSSAAVEAVGVAGVGGARRGVGGAGDKPVRLVMRTNLTFNLGHDFFQRAHRLAQHNELTEELPVSSRPAPPSERLVFPRSPEARPDDSDTTHQSSSSSESSEGT
ncbi:hypothetical protein O3G_MSEX007214 [Manduca sexta]|uniref:Ricin B lectin domain-containing protein n=1 Tax=Manduca sexta TaxID=7130 RepID=A0A921Z562_MANSE|nr:hypothetical protein O3G_MSEX007214 [Manduca sexta]